MQDSKYLNKFPHQRFWCGNKQKLEQIKHYDDFKYNNVINLIKDKPGNTDKVLYIACGNGGEIKLIGRGIGADISYNCVKNVVKLGYPGIVCDVENLPFINDHFDYVFSSSMHHFYDFDKAFSEIYRVCKKGGRIVLGPETHRYSLDQYLYNTIFRYWKAEKGMLRLTPRKIIKLFQAHKLNDIQYYYKGIAPIVLNSAIEKIFDILTERLPNSLFFWAHFYITGVK